jgi:hypothetical protein
MHGVTLQSEVAEMGMLREFAPAVIRSHVPKILTDAVGAVLLLSALLLGLVAAGDAAFHMCSKPAS